MKPQQSKNIALIGTIVALILLGGAGLYSGKILKNNASQIQPISTAQSQTATAADFPMPKTVTERPDSGKPDDEWKTILTANQYSILRKEGTETPYTGDLLHEKRKGTYVTADCNEPVFRSEQKFDSGTGWPSFWAPINPDAVVLKEDTSLGTKRVEVLGAKCGGHLGHVFEDGPGPTGLRYCMNAGALKFIPDKEQ